MAGVRYTRDWEYPAELEHTENSELRSIEWKRPWTPAPEPYTEASYRAWGRTHYGDEWDEQREQMINGRDMHAFPDNVAGDHLFLIRQAALRSLEDECERFVPMDDARYKSWDQLLEWARWLYGQDFLDQVATISRFSSDKDLAQIAKKRARLVREAVWDRHEDLLADGYTWDDLMEWPRRRCGQLQGLTNKMDFASIKATLWDCDDGDDEDDDDDDDKDDGPRSSNLPAPTAFRREAIAGPQGNIFHAYEVRTMQNLYIASQMRLDYDAGQQHNLAKLRQQRSVREEAEAQARNTAAWQDLHDEAEMLSYNMSRWEIRQEARLRPRKMKDWQVIQLLQKKKFEAIYPRKRRARLAKQEALHRQNMATLQAMVPASEKCKRWRLELWNAMDRWEVLGITIAECNYLKENFYEYKDLHGYPEREVPPRELQTPPWLGTPRVWKRDPPKNEAEMASLFRSWDGKLSLGQQNTLAKMYGFEARPESDYNNYNKSGGAGDAEDEREAGDEEEGVDAADKGGQGTNGGEGGQALVADGGRPAGKKRKSVKWLDDVTSKSARRSQRLAGQKD